MVIIDRQHHRTRRPQFLHSWTPEGNFKISVGLGELADPCQRRSIRPDAEIVLDATQSVIDTFGTAVMRHESGAPERCPECGSYSVDVGFEPELMPRPYILECENCGWQKQQEEA